MAAKKRNNENEERKKEENVAKILTKCRRRISMKKSEIM